MTDFEQEEIRQIEAIEKKEQEREARFAKILNKPVLSFEDRFNEQLSYELQRKKYKKGMSLKDYFDTNEKLSEIPVNLILNDNVQSKENVEKIINKNFPDEFLKLSQVSSEIKIENFYERAFVCNYKMMLYVVSTSSQFRGRPSYGFSSDVTPSIMDINQDQVIFAANHPNLYGKINIADSHKPDTQEKLNILKTKKKCNYLSKNIFKNITNTAKTNIPESINYFFSNINILSLNIEHLLCPIYKVRFYKKGFDAKFLINANTHKCIEL